MKLSIIIPLYNLENYIERCILSLENQDFPKSEYEIIVINDGSLDNSRVIVQKMQELFPNICLHNQKNCGLSITRNNGINYAKGKYIWFVDGDDWIEPNVINLLYHHIEENNLDLLRFKWRRIDEFNNEFPENKYQFNELSEKIMNGNDFIKDVLGYSCYAPMFWFRKDFLSKNNLFFTKGVLYEDLDAIPRWILKCNRIQFINLLVYNYYVRSNSIINSYNLRKITDYIKAIDTNYKLVIEGNIVLTKLVTYSIIGLLRMLSNPMYSAERKEAIKYLKSLNIMMNPIKGFYFEIAIYNISIHLLLYLYILLRKIKKSLNIK